MYIFTNFVKERRYLHCFFVFFFKEQTLLQIFLSFDFGVVMSELETVMGIVFVLADPTYVGVY